jgi:hypothetical protein
VKEKVSQSQPRTLDELEKQIRNTFAVLNSDFSRKSVESVSYRLYNCVENSWGPF